MNNQSKFYDHYEDAKDKKNKKLFSDAKTAYQTALKYARSINQINDHVSLLGQLGDVYKQLKLFTQSKNTFLRGIDILNTANRDRKIQEKDYMKEKYHLQSNLALTYNIQIDSIQDPFKYHQKVQMLNDSSIKQFKDCEQIVTTMLYKNHESEWWSAEYAALMANICTVLYTQALLYKDQKIFKQLLNLVERLQEFAQLYKKNMKAKKNLYKTYFYRALSYKFTKKRQLALKYFIKDFLFQKEYKQLQDLEKTRLQLILFYEEQRKFKQSMSYCQTNFQKEYVRSRITQYNQFKSKMTQIQAKINSSSFQFDDLEDFLLKFSQNQTYFKEILQFVKRIKNSTAYKKDTKVRYCCQYYCALTNFHLDNIKDAFYEIGQALNYAQGDVAQEIWCRILKAQIYDKIQPDRKKVEDSYKSCLKSAEANANQDQIRQCKTNIQKFNVYQSRRNRKIIFDQLKFKDLLNYLKMKNREPEMIEQIVQYVEIQEPEKKNYINDHLYKLMYSSVNKITWAKESNLLDIGDFFNLSQKEIETILSSNPNIQTLDLRNHLVSLQLLKILRDNEAIIGVKKLKINCVNAYTISKKTNSYYQNLFQILKKMLNLYYLSFLSLNKLDFIKKITESSSSLRLQNITVLKLKQCNLQDSDLLFFQLQNYFPKLFELSLSHNNLQGSSLGFIKHLQNLQNFDISYNPLGKVDLGIQKNKLKKITIKSMKKIPQQSLQKLMFILLKCQSIDLSNSIESCCQLLQCLFKQVYERQSQLKQLRQIKLFGCFICSSFMQTLQNMINFSPNLQTIDLRCCSVNEIIKNQLSSIKTKFQQTSNTRKILTQNLVQSQINFSLI